MYSAKPEKLPSEMRYFKSYSGKTTNIEPREMSVQDFAEYITSGHAFYPCVLTDRNGVFKTVNRQCFDSANIIAFDLEKGQHTEEKIRDTLINNGIIPCFVYRTYSHRRNGNGDRNRIVFKLPYTIRNGAEYLFLGVLFWAIYKDIDTTCIDTARLFYGTTNKTCRVIEEAVLNTEKFLSLALEAIKEAKKNDADFYARIINKLTESNINCLIDGSGLPAASVENGRIVFKDNIGARQNRMRRESTNAAIDDRTIETNAALEKITIINWYDKAMVEPLFRELVNGEGDFGYRKAVVIASNYRYIDADDVKEVFFGLLRDNPSRFSDINHTIEECRKIWEMPTATTNGGFGSRPLSYRYCGELPQDEHNYPLSFLRNVKRTLDLQRQKRVSEDLEEIFGSIDFEANPHGFLINGGTGLGKSFSILNDGETDGGEKVFSMKRALDKRYNKKMRMAFLCSRQGAKTQNNEKYKGTTENLVFVLDEDETFPEVNPETIVCITYHKFMAWVENKAINENTFDIIIADECHSLFDDNFAVQMGGFMAWVMSYPGIVVWMTANASYFQRCYNDFVALNKLPKNEIRNLYENEGQHLLMRYDVGNITYSTTSSIEYFIRPIFHDINPNHRALVYLKSAAECYSYYRQAIKMGLRAAFYVSSYCDTELKKEDDIDEDVRAYLEENGLFAIPMNKVFDIQEDERAKRNSERIKDALLKGENFPADIDIIFTTDALRESININPESNVKVIITDDYTEVGVLQKRGRVRADIERYIIVPNRHGTERGIVQQINAFEGNENSPGVLSMSQQQLAEEYGKQKKTEQLHKRGTAYVLRTGNPEDGTAVYTPNRAAYIGLRAKLEEYRQINPPDKEHNKLAAEKYGVLTSSGFVNIVYAEPARRIFIDKEVAAVAEKYVGLPLIGETAERLIEECRPFLRNSEGEKEFELNLVLKEIRAAGYEVKRGKVGKKHLKQGVPEAFFGKDFRVIVAKQ